jgi:hypothetical protein
MGNKTRTAKHNAGFDTGMARRNRLQVEGDTATFPGHHSWPSLRVAREAQWQHADNQDWNHYLNDLASQNRRYGRVRPLGALSCTLVADVEIRRMIHESRPSVKGSLARTKEYYRSLGRQLTQYVRETSTVQNELTAGWRYGERFRFAQAKALEKIDDIGCAWNDLQVETEKLEVYGHNKIGIDLSRSDELWHERNEIKTFLRKEERLDTSLMDKEWEPHLVIFEAGDNHEPSVGALNWPRHQVMPGSMMLHMPHARAEQVR